MKRAIEYRRFGGPEVLEEAEYPEQAPGDGEVRIAVRAVGLNPLDFKTFRGDLRRLERVQRIIHPRRWFEGASAHFPRGVARDFAGVIDAVGTNVPDLAVGDAVLGTLRSAPGQADTRGALTTELVAPADDVVTKPASLYLTQAACLGVAAQTACGAFRQLNLREGDVIVISAAAGGVGSVASQLAVSRGATVIGIAGARNTDYLRSLGAIPVTYGENLTRHQAPGLLRRHLRTAWPRSRADGPRHRHPGSLTCGDPQGRAVHWLAAQQWTRRPRGGGTAGGGRRHQGRARPHLLLHTGADSRRLHRAGKGPRPRQARHRSILTLIHAHPDQEKAT